MGEYKVLLKSNEASDQKLQFRLEQKIKGFSELIGKD